MSIRTAIRRPRSGRTLAVGALACQLLSLACVTDRFERLVLTPAAAAGDAKLADPEIETVLAATDALAAQFEFERIVYSPRAEQAIEQANRLYGITLLAEYARERAPGAGAYVLLQVFVNDSRSQIVIAVRTLRGGSASSFLAEVRDTAERRLREALPGWRIESESGAVDATLAP
jgi:hypothetical protein